MITLGIDTACQIGSVGLADGEKLLAELTYQAAMSQSEKLLVSVDELFKTTGVAKKDLKLISVSTGPGSFTGLRIGMATAKGLALSLGVSLIGVPTCDTYQAKVAFWPGKICVLIVDRKNLVYQALFEGDEKVVTESSTPKEKVFQKAGQANDDNPWLFIGSGVEKYREEIKKVGGIPAPPSLNTPSSFTVARLGQKKINMGESDNLCKLEPLYAQRPIAEVKFEKK